MSRSETEGSSATIPSEIPAPEGTRVQSAEGLSERLERGLWVFLSVALVVGLFGYGFFTLRPENLIRFPQAAHIHAPAMIIGAQIQSVGFIALAAVCVSRAWGGKLALLLFLALTVVGFLAEWVGTTTGLPFGKYAYTEMLGYKILGEVPWVIPPSWFAMGIPCFVLAHFASRARTAIGGVVPWTTRILRIVLGAWFLMSWDLVLDPAMSALLPYWQWYEPGFYYNSPFLNFVGWFLVGLVIMILVDLLTHRRVLGPLSFRWSLGFYALNWVMSGGMCLLAGEWLALVVGVVALVPLAACYRSVSSQSFALNAAVPAAEPSLRRALS